jgi:hypothetical protein
MALSRGERREQLQIAQFVRGLAIQVTYRFVRRELLVVPGRATLLYSRLDRPRCGILRSAAAVAAATFAGLALFVLSNTLLLLPVTVALRAGGAGTNLTSAIALTIVVIRLGWTATRAVRTYLLEWQREKHLPRVGEQPRWRLDLMGATPAHCGNGTTLLRELVHLSDAAGATVYLVTEPHNRAFYRRGGFHLVPNDAKAFDGMVLMRRVTPTAKGRLPRQRLSAAVQLASR